MGTRNRPITTALLERFQKRNDLDYSSGAGLTCLELSRISGQNTNCCQKQLCREEHEMNAKLKERKREMYQQSRAHKNRSVKSRNDVKTMLRKKQPTYRNDGKRQNRTRGRDPAETSPDDVHEHRPIPVQKLSVLFDNSRQVRRMFSHKVGERFHQWRGWVRKRQQLQQLRNQHVFGMHPLMAGVRGAMRDRVIHA